VRANQISGIIPIGARELWGNNKAEITLNLALLVCHDDSPLEVGF
jgi:hypothetical protein